MQVIRTPSDAASIANLELQALVQKTIRALSEDYPYNPDALGKIVIVQPGDTLATINAQVGFDILCNRWTGLRYDHVDYTPAFEILEEYASCFDLLFIIDDSGFGIELFIQKDIDIPDLLAMCYRYGVPGIL